MRWALLAVVGGILAVLAVPVAAQQPPASSVAIFGTQVGTTEAVASVSVLDGAGNPVQGLSAGSFTATVDGASAQVTGLETGLGTNLPLALVIVVDTSGSMAGAPIAAAKTAILPIVQSLQPGDRAALVGFANQVTTVVPFTTEQGTLAAGLNSLAAAGNTALYAAVTQAAALAGGATEPRKAVVLLSDGEDFGNVSGVTRDQAIAAATASGVPFFVVGLGQVDTQFLSTLSATGAGQVFIAATPAELGTLYDRVSARLRLQYSLRVALPATLANGEHRLRVAVGPVAGEATFTVARPATTTARLTGLEGQLREPAVVTLDGAPAGAQVTFALDGAPVQPGPDGRTVELDPYRFDPYGGTPGELHVLTASFDQAGKKETVELRFSVAALPPKLVAPRELPTLAPGDLVRLTVDAQGGKAKAIFLIDGEEQERDLEPPYEFVLPREGLTAGKRTLTVALEAPGGRAEQQYDFDVAGGGGSNLGAYLILAAAAAAALAAVGYGSFLIVGRLRAREPALDVSGAGEALATWAAGRRGEAEGAERPSAPAPVLAPGAWGRLVVVSGPDTGRTFELASDTELVGRGKFCTVRLKDKRVEEAHFVVAREGDLHASTPHCRLAINGAEARSAQLEAGDEVRLGATLLRFERP